MKKANQYLSQKKGPVLELLEGLIFGPLNGLQSKCKMTRRTTKHSVVGNVVKVTLGGTAGINMPAGTAIRDTLVGTHLDA